MAKLKTKIEPRPLQEGGGGNHWLELVRNWIIEANKVKNFVLSDNFLEMKTPPFFIKGRGGSNRRIFDQRLFIDFKKPWNYLYFLPAETQAPSEARGEGEINRLWWTRWDLNPRSPGCKPGILPLNYRPKHWTN